MNYNVSKRKLKESMKSIDKDGKSWYSLTVEELENMNDVDFMNSMKLTEYQLLMPILSEVYKYSKVRINEIENRISLENIKKKIDNINENN